MGKISRTNLVFADTDNGGIIHVANIKGGVGKSTVATNLAASLAENGRTLLIDLDVQGSATVALGKEPSECKSSSWEMFQRRFCNGNNNNTNGKHGKHWLNYKLSLLEQKLFGWIIGKGEITSLAITIQPCLDLIPANSDLFKTPKWFQLQNFLYNLRLCRSYYKYIVIDTPSVWNKLTLLLYLNSNLNLIPVTLNALSTKSLKEYLLNVKKLSEKNPNVKVRVVKNEVFGKENSKIKGKTRTMFENRRFLENLCEQVVIQSASGISLVPKSIILDLEIPESAVVRNAQDEGKPVQLYQQYASVTKAFEELAKRIQYILNTEKQNVSHNILERHNDLFSFAGSATLLFLFVAILCINTPVHNTVMPRPVAIPHIVESSNSAILYKISGNESIYKLAKNAISRFTAIVPRFDQVQQYIKETIAIYNNTRMPEEPKIENLDRLPVGIVLPFYPPSQFNNPMKNEMVPAYNFFLSMVKDPYAYITGDWCERGTGGGKPHYGIDVAAKFGSQIISPIDGIAYVRNSNSAGRTIGIVRENSVIFFCHLDKIYINSGAKVSKGTPIGTIGTTGKTSGPHVHIGYGIRTLSNKGLIFGTDRFEITDPKLFFYRQAFVEDLEQKK